jgi:hypothetical protein
LKTQYPQSNFFYFFLIISFFVGGTIFAGILFSDSPRKGQNILALKGQYKIRTSFLFCPFRAMEVGKFVTHRVAVGWVMLPLAGRISEYLKNHSPQKTK